MGRWEPHFRGSERATYRQIVKEGFILTQGDIALSFDNHPFGNLNLNYPSFQLLRVHRNYPIEVVDCGGGISVMPQGDKRLPGQIWGEKNPNVYDSVSFFMAPYEIQLPENYPGRVFTNLDGFVKGDGSRSRASLVYIGKRGMNIDGQYVDTFCSIPPSQVSKHFRNWAYSLGNVHGYDNKAPFGEGWKTIGRFDLKDTGGLQFTVAGELEKRFKTRLLPERPRR